MSGSKPFKKIRHKRTSVRARVRAVAEAQQKFIESTAKVIDQMQQQLQAYGSVLGELLVTHSLLKKKNFITPEELQIHEQEIKQAQQDRAKQDSEGSGVRSEETGPDGDSGGAGGQSVLPDESAGTDSGDGATPDEG
jgi:hypothetical protein